ncbi:coil containing protein [Vibrio phage 1.005.O._10N.286.48.F2]|nr:coil containing protein [Vibrio phage 1.005.O._10N.286.48.F2]
MKNYSTERVDMTNGGYALFVGGKVCLIGNVKFNGCGDEDSGTIQWVMNSIGEMIAESPSKTIPPDDYRTINFADDYIGEEKTQKQIELEEKLELAANELANYLREA